MKRELHSKIAFLTDSHNRSKTVRNTSERRIIRERGWVEYLFLSSYRVRANALDASHVHFAHMFNYISCLGSLLAMCFFSRECVTRPSPSECCIPASKGNIVSQVISSSVNVLRDSGLSCWNVEHRSNYALYGSTRFAKIYDPRVNEHQLMLRRRALPHAVSSFIYLFNVYLAVNPMMFM